MELIHERCAGLDVHKKTVVACVRVANARKVKYETRTYETTTGTLLELCDWLESMGCTHVAMESTGVYWKPVWHALEDAFSLTLGNAARMKNVPGRKSDVSDARWIADLLAHGLIAASFVPPQPIQELRELTRTRKQLVREKVRYIQRIQKVLEDANIKLGNVISEVMGATGRRIIQAIVDGESEPGRLAELARGSLIHKKALIAESLRGFVTDHHRFMLGLHMNSIQGIEAAIKQIEKRIGASMRPFSETAERLTTIPGISATAADVIVAEVGVDMDRFPTHEHLVSWAGLCPGMDTTAGKTKSTRIRKGAPWLKTVLVQCAWAAIRSKHSYLRAQYYRLRSRRGGKKAIIAVAASILTGAYYIIRDGVPWKDLGADYFDRRNRERLAENLKRKLMRLGYNVELNAAA